MTAQRQPLERTLATWMADEAAGAPEAVLAQILETTARTTPRPRVWALVAEPTLRTRTTRAAVGLPNRGLVLATVVALLLAAVAALGIGAALILRSAGGDGGDFPGFHGDASRYGQDLVGPDGNPVTAWRAQAGGAVFEVVVVGDRAFFASQDGRLHAVARETGTEAWAIDVPDPPLTGPFAADGRLYVADSAGLVHAYRSDDGSLAWTSPTTYREPSRAVVADGSVYLGTGDGLVVALDAATGAERWRLQVPGATRVDAPAVASGLVYAGTDGAGFVAIDPTGPRVAWTGDTDGENTGSASVVDGIAYIGADADPSATGTLHAFDAVTGRPLWTAVDPALGMPGVADGVAYTTSLDGAVEAIDTETGIARWRVRLDGAPHSPVVIDGVAFLNVDAAKRVVAIDAATGAELWSYDLDANPNCCLAVAKGMVFVGTLSGSVYAIAGDGKPLAPAPAASAGTTSAPAASASAVPTPSVAPIPDIGSIAWSTDLRDKGFAPVGQIAVDPTTGDIWAPAVERDRFAIIAPDGTFREEWGDGGSGPGQFDLTRDNGDGYGTLAFAADGSFYVLDVGNRRVQQFDAQRRFVRQWGTFGKGPREYTDPVGIAVAADGTVWVLDDVRSVVEHYDPTGTILGSFDPFARTPVNNGANNLAIDSAGRLSVSGAVPSQIDVFDASGQFIRTIGAGDFAEQAGNMAIDASGRTFVTQGPGRGSRPGVLVFGPNGSLIGGSTSFDAGADRLVFPGGIALDGHGGLYVEDSDPDHARLVKLDLGPSFGGD